MKKVLAFAYGVAVYVLFLLVFVYLIGFVGDVAVPKSIDDPGGLTLSLSFWGAVAVDVGLLSLFAVQHSVMARQWFKRRWTQIVPTHVERSTYVLAATVVLAVVMWGWQPVAGPVWEVESAAGVAALQAIFWAGWGVVLLSTFLIDHFRLFGLSQVWAHLRGNTLEPPRFEKPGLYRWVRHPLYLGFLMAFWSAPVMTVGHLLFAGVWTSWILLAIRFEERDLVRFHGDAYARYRDEVPMLVPAPRRAEGARRGGEELKEA